MNKAYTDWLSRWAEYSPIKTAVKDGHTGHSLTYDQLNSASENLVEYLISEFNIEKGDRITVIGEFSLPVIVLFGAAMKAGFILVPLNYRLAAPEIKYLVDNSDPALIVVEDKFRDLLAEVDAQRQNKIPYLSPLKLEEAYDQPAMVNDMRREYSRPEPEDPLFILYTSGTTGFPKGAIYTHKMAFWNSVNTQLRLDITAGDHTITCMPPFHTGGWNVLLTPFLHHGASVTILRKFEAALLLDKLEEEECTIFMGVPTMLKMMAEESQFEAVDLHALRYFIVGGEAMPVSLIQKWQEKGIPVRQGYGLTEAGPNITSLHQDDAIRKIGSIGKPNFYVNYKLVDEDEKPVGQGEEGELWVSGPMVTSGYWKNPKASRKALKGGWFRTGDILTCDEQGYLYVKDRLKNMFISGGENIYPAEVEKVLETNPAISEVAVIGVADDKWGEVGKALIVCSDHLTKDDILRFCEGKLAKFKIPKHIEFVKELPRTESGKIDRKNLLKSV